jgi:hypothetical protein
MIVILNVLQSGLGQGVAVGTVTDAGYPFSPSCSPSCSMAPGLPAAQLAAAPSVPSCQVPVL